MLSLDGYLDERRKRITFVVMPSLSQNRKERHVRPEEAYALIKEKIELYLIDERIELIEKWLMANVPLVYGGALWISTKNVDEARIKLPFSFDRYRELELSMFRIESSISQAWTETSTKEIPSEESHDLFAAGTGAWTEPGKFGIVAIPRVHSFGQLENLVTDQNFPLVRELELGPVYLFEWKVPRVIDGIEAEIDPEDH